MRARTIVANGSCIATDVGLPPQRAAAWSGAVSSSLGGAASVAPSDAVAFVALDTDVSSGQWHAVDGLLNKFPWHDKLLANLQQSFEQHTKLSWADDVKPALGSELDLIALPGKKPQLVGLTQGGDQTKLDALLQKLDKGTCRSRSAAGRRSPKPGRARRGQERDDEALGQQHVSRRDREARRRRARARLRERHRGAAAARVARQADPGGLDAAVRLGIGRPRRLRRRRARQRLLARRLDAEGVAPALQRSPGRRRIRRTSSTRFPPAPCSSPTSRSRPASSSPPTHGAMPEAVAEAVRRSPTFPNELDTVLGGETAVYVRPGLPIPEVTIVTQPNDTAAPSRRSPTC